MELDYPDDNGVTLRDRLEQVEEQTGRSDPRLDSLEVPAAGAHLWQWFWELRRDGTITYQEIESWCRLTGQGLSPWEAGTLREMDAAVSEYLGERMKRRQQTGVGHSTAGNTGRLPRGTQGKRGA